LGASPGSLHSRNKSKMLRLFLAPRVSHNWGSPKYFLSERSFGRLSYQVAQTRTSFVFVEFVLGQGYYFYRSTLESSFFHQIRWSIQSHKVAWSPSLKERITCGTTQLMGPKTKTSLKELYLHVTNSSLHELKCKFAVSWTTNINTNGVFAFVFIERTRFCLQETAEEEFMKYIYTSVLGFGQMLFCFQKHSSSSVMFCCLIDWLFVCLSVALCKMTFLMTLYTAGLTSHASFSST